MFKKRKYKKNTPKQKRTRAIGETRAHEDSGRSHARLLYFLYGCQAPCSVQDIQEYLKNDTLTRKEIKDALEDLCRQNLATRDRKNLYQLASKAPVYEGVLSQHPRGFGFVTNCRKKDGGCDLERDPFISQGKLAGAHHNDKVLVQVLRIRKDKRPEGNILGIISYASDELYGAFRLRGDKAYVYPDDPGFPFIVSISIPGDLSPADGEIVKVKIVRESLSGKEIQGKVTEVVGAPESVDTQICLVSGKFTLPAAFSETTIKEIAALDGNITMDSNTAREDLRELPHVTIDGETAKDFDDAVCVQKTRKGFTLYVSIADVSHYVQPNSAIDQDAFTRGTSIYFPGRVIPMLPERLSNELCSLVPDQDRFTVTAVLKYDRSGKLQDSSFCRSIIRSHKRFTYNEVAKILSAADADVRRANKQHLTHLKWMSELATELLGRKKQRGAIDFDLAEAAFSLTDEGWVADIKAAERNFAHRIIEEFMLAANEAVATLFSKKKLVAMYRVHEVPDALKAEEFYSFAQTLGQHIPPLENEPQWYNTVIANCRGTKHEYIINNLILRTMQQAHYSAHNLGHFGLALKNYTHFTSPIRRYPDLIVHRVLLHYLASASYGETRNPEEMEKKGIHLSSRERMAMNAEREIADRLKLQFMKNKGGEKFAGIISGISDGCLFVEIPELCVSGSIDLIHLDDDYYLIDTKHHRLFGEISAKTYQIGDPIWVQLTDVDVPRKRINFIPV